MVIAALETYGADPVFSVPISLHAGWVCAALLLNVNLANVQLKLGGDATTRQAIDLTLVFGSLYGATIIGAGVIALSGNVILPLSIVWALVAIGVEAPNSPAGAKYTRAAVKYTALILAAKLAALPGPKAGTRKAVVTQGADATAVSYTHLTLPTNVAV